MWFTYRKSSITNRTEHYRKYSDFISFLSKQGQSIIYSYAHVLELQRYFPKAVALQLETITFMGYYVVSSVSIKALISPFSKGTRRFDMKNVGSQKENGHHFQNIKRSNLQDPQKQIDFRLFCPRSQLLYLKAAVE